MNKIMMLLVCGLTVLQMAQASETKEFDSTGLSELILEVSAGNISISETTTTKSTVAFHKRYFPAECQLVIERAEHKLQVKARPPQVGFESSSLGKKSCEVDFEIKIPKKMNLDLGLGKGKVTIVGIEGALNFKIGNADLLAQGAFGITSGHSANGAISIKGLTGGGQINSGNGKVDLEFIKQDLNGEFSLRTGNGNATALFVKGTKVRCDFKSGIGKLTNELGDDPKAPFRLSIQSGTGNLNVKYR